MAEAWPALPYDEWKDTLDTLHMFTQIVGKVRLELAADEPQWAHVPLYLTARGLWTSAMPWGDGSLDMEFDFVEHELVLRVHRGAVRCVGLEGRSVADFYRDVMDALDAVGVNVSIWTMPVEFDDPIPFPDDEVHASYDRVAVERFFDVLTRVAGVLHEHRGRFRGKTSPVHFWWGTFDLANTRFSGRSAEPPPDADPILRGSYDAEQITAGFWPGDARFPEPAFFAYGYPQPDGIDRTRVEPGPAFWSPEHGLFLLRYDDVRNAADPRAVIREFLESTYASCASLMGWDHSLVGPPS